MYSYEYLVLYVILVNIIPTDMFNFTGISHLILKTSKIHHNHWWYAASLFKLFTADYCKKLDCLVHVRDLLEGMFVYFLEVQSDRLFEEEPENCNSLLC